MPDWQEPIRQRLKRTPLDPAREAEVAEELSTHLEDRYRELLATGMPSPEAECAAAAELETLAVPPRPRPEPLPVGGAGGPGLLAGVGHDLKVAARMMRSKPAFSSAVIFMLAVGIAGNGAIFSIFNGMFLRPLPFPHPERLVDLDETAPKWNLVRVGISNPDYAAWQKGNSTFEGMAFWGGAGGNISGANIPSQRIEAAVVTWNLLSVVGLKPLVGRDFLPEEDRPNGPKVVLLGYDLWQRLFHGDPNIVGASVKNNEQPFTVIGVLPPEAVIPPRAEAWTLLQVDTTRGGGWYLGGIGRLKPNVTMQQAESDLRRVHFARPEYKDAEAYPVLAPVRDRYLGDFKVVTRILLGAVGVVLLIACVNVAGLMLVRGESRSREIAIRTAIGASRGRVVRQLLTESLLLAAIGGALGVLLGKAALIGLVAMIPTEVLPKWVGFSLDGRFALFCAAVTGAAAVLCGLAPAFQAASVDTRGALGESARSTLTRGKRGVLGALVVCEIALAVVLMLSSGLILQAFRRVLHEDLGFRTENILTWSARPAGPNYAKPEMRYALFHSAVERLRALPGVIAASAASIIPMNGHQGQFFEAEGGRTIGSNEKNPVVLRVTALAGYVETIGIRLKAGRSFDARDEQPNAPTTAIVNETFARHFWGHSDVVGKRIRYPRAETWMTVVGLMQDMRHYGADQQIRPEVLTPFPHASPGGMTFVVRGASDPRALVPGVRDVMRQVDADLPMYDIRTMAERLDRSLWARRTYSWLFGAFAAVAVLLAAAGVYGVISFAVSQRTREIGIRIALGARPSQVMRGVLTGGMALVALGAGIGLIGAQFTGRLLDTMLFGISPHDLGTYLLVVAVLAGVGLLANYVPARRAARVEPMQALRSE
jgi:putative ABC transport system permease protein